MLSTHRVLCVFISFILMASIASASNSMNKQKNKTAVTSFSKLTKTKETSHYLPDKIIIKLKSTTGLAKTARSFGISGLDKVLQQYSVTSLDEMFQKPATYSMKPAKTDLSRIYTAKFTAPVDAFEFAKEVSKDPNVEYAEPWFIYPVDNVTSAPNDSFRTNQWALNRIKADTAFALTSGSDNVVIGIVDVGVQWDHPDLAANIWINPGEDGLDSLGHDKRTNGIDDDGDGLIDDWHGWDFGGADYNNPVGDNNPIGTTDNVSHGTHVAGIADAVTNNHRGIAGVANNCKLLPVKVGSDNDARGGGAAYIVFGFQGIKYAADMGATVINCSWGGGGFSQFEQDVVNYARDKGTLIVAASGNDNAHTASYPAAYDGVLSVTAREYSVNELRASYADYDESVDVSAPGGQGTTPSSGILSTYIDSGYAVEYGTSMASPHVAGLVALIKSKFPNMNAFQAGEQARVTSDPINNQPTYANLLGKGRINAFKAVTDTLIPSIRIDSFYFDDKVTGNGDGIPDPGETLYVYCKFRNYLHATTSGATVSINSTVPANIQVLTDGNSNVFHLGALGTLDTVSNASAPFKIVIGGAVNTNVASVLRFDISDNSLSYSDYQWETFLLNAVFLSHRVSNVDFSVTNFGSLGYHDYTQNVPYGVSYGDGFQYPIGFPSALYHATILVATDSNHVIDNAYGNSTSNLAVDWKTSASNPFSFPDEGGATQVFRCGFTDSSAGTSRLGLRVIQRSYAYANRPDNDYIMLRYDVYNTHTGTTSADTIKNAYVGIYADWDVVNFAQSNDALMDNVGYDSTRSLGYMWDSTGSYYYGVSVVNTPAVSFRAINNPTYVYNQFTDGDKWKFMHDGFVMTKSDAVDDWSFLVTAGPFTIPPGAYQMVGFAFLGGDSLAALQANADAAHLKGAAVLGVSNRPNGLPAAYSLYQNFPNPFNPVTKISYDLPNRSHVSLKVYDILGHEIATLIDDNQPAGSYTTRFDGSRFASGVYYYRLVTDNFVQTKKLMLLK